MYKMKFNASELPYHEFEKVGLKKKDVLGLPVDSLNALLSGRRSDFIRIDADGMKLDVKTSLHRNADNSVSLRFHPINHTARNIYNLTEAQERILQNGEAKGIVIDSKKQNGEPTEVLVQYDSETKEYVSINLNDIPLPEKINDVKLTEEQRSDWKKGKEIEVDGEPVRLSLTNTMGFVGKVFMFALDGGISIAIAAMMKEYNKREAEKNSSGALPMNLPNVDRSAVTGSFINTEKGGGPNTGDLTSQYSRENARSVTGVDQPSVAVEKSVDQPKRNEVVGTLVEHGAAPYNHDPQEKASYYVILNQGGKESTIWGVGLKDAIEKSGVNVGEEISIQRTGRKPVTVTSDRKDELGNKSTEKIDAHRNEWTVGERAQNAWKEADRSQRTVKR